MSGSAAIAFNWLDKYLSWSMGLLLCRTCCFFCSSGQSYSRAVIMPSGAGLHGGHSAVKDSWYEHFHPRRCHEGSGGNDGERSTTESSCSSYQQWHRVWLLLLLLVLIWERLQTPTTTMPDTTVQPLGRHRQWQYPQNQKYITYCNTAKRGQSNSHRQHAQKISEG